MYRRSVVTFIDVLGFKDIVAKKSFDEVRGIVRLMQRFAGAEAGDPFAPEVIAFSDSIIRVRPIHEGINAEYSYGCVYWEILDLLHAQTELVNRGVLIRGGIALGDIHIEDGQVFGPGLIASYELESSYANFPRIVVSPELLRELDTNPALVNCDHAPADEKEYLAKILRRGEDGLHFIDYLRACRGELDDPDDYPPFLASHKQLILGESAGASLSRTTAKYLWLANYHNSVVDELDGKGLKAMGVKKTGLAISTKEMASLSRL